MVYVCVYLCVCAPRADVALLCVSASSLAGRAAASCAPPPPACPPGTGAAPPPLQMAACTRPPDLGSGGGQPQLAHSVHLEYTKLPEHSHCLLPLLTVSRSAPGCQFPQHQAEGIHVDAQECVALEVNGAFEYLRGHVAPRPHLQGVPQMDSHKLQYYSTHSSPFQLEIFVKVKLHSNRCTCNNHLFSASPLPIRCKELCCEVTLHLYV